MKKLVAYGDRIIVKREDAETKTASGIIIPEDSVKKDKPLKGTIVTVGEGSRRADGSFNTMKLAEGEAVYFGKYAGVEHTMNGVKYVILREDDILAVEIDGE